MIMYVLGLIQRVEGLGGSTLISAKISADVHGTHSEVCVWAKGDGLAIGSYILVDGGCGSGEQLA
jgi:hypothetical protein